MKGLKRSFENIRAKVLGLHRDERGELLETLLIMAVFVIPLAFITLPVLWKILQDYYLAFAYCVGWPFL